MIKTVTKLEQQGTNRNCNGISPPDARDLDIAAEMEKAKHSSKVGDQGVTRTGKSKTVSETKWPPFQKI